MGTGAVRRSILQDGGLNLGLLRELATRPAPFTPGDPDDEAYWGDPAVGDQILRLHLEWREGEHYRPSLEPALFDQISRWLISRLGLRPGQRVLDLGCAVGHYARSLTEHGLDVTGIDIVPVLIEYARNAAGEQGLAIDYRCGDYRDIDYVADFDAILQLGGAFQYDSPSRRDGFLRRIHRALKPGGHYVPELLTNLRHCGNPPRTWECDDGALGPELLLVQTEDYPEDDVSLWQTVMIHPDGTVRLHRTWQTDYTPATATALLRRHGFAVEGCWEDVTGKPYVDTSDMLCVVARAV
jgi:cyclopropane fatty-acyl-phospholipid synthase-like methyltransferase